MILAWLVIVLFGGGLAAWILGRKNPTLSRWVSLSSLAVDLVLLSALWLRSYGYEYGGAAPWLIEMKAPWIPALGASFHLALDGLSLLMVTLTIVLGFIAVACSWTEIRESVGFFHFNILAVLAGIVGVFLSLDLFLFYFFWELMLVPMYFLIALWGHENRRYASMKFFIFTQAGGLLMLLSILGLYFVHGRGSGVYTFDYQQLLGTSLPPSLSFWLMLGFFVAFAVKLPAVPFHPWLADAHTEAPTAGSVILAGLLLKTGAYGMLRFLVPLFPKAIVDVRHAGMVLGITGILYGAALAFAQRDLKRLIAYSSISHMGFVLLGISVWNETALQGVVVQMVAHGISTGALFVVAGSLQERIHTRDMERMGGLWSTIPRMGGTALLFALASLGLPGLGNFVGEFLVLLGSYRTSPVSTAFAAAGFVTSAIYVLWMIQRVFHGERREDLKPADLTGREMSIVTVLAVLIVWIGLYPQPVFDTVGPALKNLREGSYAAESKGQGVYSENRTFTPSLALPPQGGGKLKFGAEKRHGVSPHLLKSLPSPGGRGSRGGG